MAKTLKILGIAFGALLLLGASIAGWVASQFDPNDYKPEIIRLVQEKQQRTLAIPGTITLRFFPSIGADLGQLSLSERNAKAEFASVERASVSLRLWPLLKKQVVVDTIEIDGLRARVRRDADGSTSIDDLIGKKEKKEEEQAPSPLAFDIAQVRLKNASVEFDDRQARRTVAVQGLDLRTGRIASGVPSELQLSAQLRSSAPALDAKLNLKTGFTLDTQRRALALKDTQASVDGSFAQQRIALKLETPLLQLAPEQVSGGRLAAQATLRGQGRELEMKITTPPFAAAEGGFKLNELAITVSGKQGDMPIKGALVAALVADLPAQRVELHRINASLQLPNPAGGEMALTANGNGALQMKAKALDLKLQGMLDTSRFSANLGADLSQPAWRFDVNLDSLDMDRYRAKDSAKDSGKLAAGDAGKTAKATPATDTPINLAGLKDLRASGSLKIGTLRAQGLLLTGLNAKLQAGGGKLELAPLSASLYGGSLSGSLSATASERPRVVIAQTLKDVQIAPLLKDFIGKEPVEGRGNVTLDASTEGSSVLQMKRNLNGNAKLALHDGAIRGINIAQALRNAKSKLDVYKQAGAAQAAGTASASSEKTDFSELTATVRIAGVIARNDDLDGKSPLLRIRGNGQANLVEEKLDYTVTATAVPSLQGQGGPELQALKGVPVPVRLTGPFSNVSWKLDLASVAQQMGKQKLEQKKEEVKGQLQQKLGDQLKGLFGR